MQQHFVYILFSVSKNKYYIGATSQSVEHRLAQHLAYHTGFTGKAKDWKIVFTKSFTTRQEAMAFERQIKKWKSSASIERLMRSTTE